MRDERHYKTPSYHLSPSQLSFWLFSKTSSVLDISDSIPSPVSSPTMHPNLAFALQTIYPFNTFSIQQDLKSTLSRVVSYESLNTSASPRETCYVRLRTNNSRLLARYHRFLKGVPALNHEWRDRYSRISHQVNLDENETVWLWKLDCRLVVYWQSFILQVHHT